MDSWVDVAVPGVAMDKAVAGEAGGAAVGTPGVLTPGAGAVDVQLGEAEVAVGAPLAVEAVVVLQYSSDAEGPVVSAAPTSVACGGLAAKVVAAISAEAVGGVCLAGCEQGSRQGADDVCRSSVGIATPGFGEVSAFWRFVRGTTFPGPLAPGFWPMGNWEPCKCR